MRQRVLYWLWCMPPWLHTLIAHRLGGWRIVRRSWLNSDREEYRIERWRNLRRP